MNWTKTDAGRSASQRPEEKRDCTVRALATAFGMTYDAAHDFLAGHGRKYGTGFHLERLLDQSAHRNLVMNTMGNRTADVQFTGPGLLGRKITKYSFPAEKWKSRMNVEEFCARYITSGTFIIRCAGHFACVRYGTLLDETECRAGKACVYCAFKIGEPEPTP